MLISNYGVGETSKQARNLGKGRDAESKRKTTDEERKPLEKTENSIYHN
jgi:hypothetical protein